MRHLFQPLARVAVGAALALLSACGGGGDSSSSTVTGAGLNSLGLSPSVNLAFVQSANNLQVVVEDGPHGFHLAPNANILYTTVTVCVPGGDPANPADCQSIDHIQVDTGSVGLRVLASQVKRLALPPLALSPTQALWECYPFVIGGLWGATAGADVRLGRQTAAAVPVQLIEDDASAQLQATPDCYQAADQNILGSALALGANGILGIGSTTLDCGQNCLLGNYNNSFVQYYRCPPAASSSAACSPAAVPANLQMFNPVAALPAPYNNGVVLKMPAIPDSQPVGAATAGGELIFGIDTVGGPDVHSNNLMPATATKVYLGVDPVNLPDAYLNVSTRITGGLTAGLRFASSYLDTGTNGLFFNDGSVPLCAAGNAWYCPPGARNASAVLSDGDQPAQDPVFVAFQVGNAEALFSTQNTAFANAAGAAPPGSTTFAWGMPFFYGRQVYLSIWQQAGALDGPWYAWTGL
jgi:hypothetical protein